jgi:ferredoxin
MTDCRVPSCHTCALNIRDDESVDAWKTRIRATLEALEAEKCRRRLCCRQCGTTFDQRSLTRPDRYCSQPCRDHATYLRRKKRRAA